MGCCATFAPALLVHVNLILAAFGGTALATAARLKWDPSTYVAVRALLPAEYRAAAVALLLGGLLLLLLAHLAAAALALDPHTRARARRRILITYAVVMGLVVVGEAAWAAWTAWRVAAWLHTDDAQQMMEVLEIRDHIRPLLQFLGRWHPLPDTIKAVMDEAEADAPRNMYVACAAVAVLALAQPLAAVLALLVAAAAPPAPASPPPHHRRHYNHTNHSISSSDSERAPLKATYKNGRLMFI